MPVAGVTFWVTYKVMLVRRIVRGRAPACDGGAVDGGLDGHVQPKRITPAMSPYPHLSESLPQLASPVGVAPLLSMTPLGVVRQSRAGKMTFSADRRASWRAFGARPRASAWANHSCTRVRTVAVDPEGSTAATSARSRSSIVRASVWFFACTVLVTWRGWPVTGSVPTKTRSRYRPLSSGWIDPVPLGRRR